MPDPDVSNRERLLRLIDGGTEALKEFERQNAPRPAPPEKAGPAVSAWATGRRAFETWKAKVLSAKPELLRLAQWLLLFVLVLASLRYGVETLKALSGQPPTVSSAAPEEGAGTGLRLVGVDSSGPAVALLEDLKTGKTYFAKVNDRVKNVRVKQIAKNSVLVSVRGRTVELR